MRKPGRGGGGAEGGDGGGRRGYYGACAPGLEECIAEVLGERCPDLRVSRLLSGAVIFESALPYDRLNLFCFNNLFRLISGPGDRELGDYGPEGERGSREALEHFVRRSIRLKTGRARIAEGGALPGGGPGPGAAGRAGGRGAGRGAPDVSFRVIFSLENTPAAVSEDLRRKAEGYLAAASGLRLDRRNPSVEFWFLLRREGAFFMRRLSRHRPWDKLLHPGELPPPLAWMLCKLSAPRNGERVADPFCGYGSIPEARLRHFPPAEFFASDIDRDALKAARAKFRGEAQHHCVFNRCDARELSRLIPPASLDSIITDPPWGFYRDLPAGDLYHQSMKTFSGLLKPGGRIVLLCGRGEEARRAAAGNGFTVARHIPILLSGRKAAIYVLRTGAGGTGRQACRAPRMGAGGTR